MTKLQAWLRGERGEWYVAVQGVLFALILLGPPSLPGLPIWTSTAARWLQPVGLVAALAGMGMCAMALLNLGPNLTPYPRPKANATFVGHGMYQFVRHPIYCGILSAALGWALYRQSTLILLYTLLLFLFFDIKSRREEQWLQEKYAEYAGYRRRVKKLIPFVY
ncbi:MAG: isoprenylcysteine carboxylmethyltransferase family protein [Caldilineaceae bacterium]